MLRTWVSLAVGGIAALAAPRAAHAGRTAFGWLYDTETMPERGVELQQWISEEDAVGPTKLQQTNLQWGPVIGITDQLELTLPVDLVWTRPVGSPGNFTFDWFRFEGRYRFVTADPVEAPAFVPLVRLAIDRNVLDRGSVHAETDLVVSWTHDRVHAVVDVGLYADLHNADGVGVTTNRFALHPGAGVSVRVTDEVRLGAEIFAQEGLSHSDDPNWLAIGPDFAWTHGRFWLTATYGIGLSGINAAPRVLWGVAF